MVEVEQPAPQYDANSPIQFTDPGNAEIDKMERDREQLPVLGVVGGVVEHGELGPEERAVNAVFELGVEGAQGGVGAPAGVNNCEAGKEGGGGFEVPDVLRGFHDRKSLDEFVHELVGQGLGPTLPGFIQPLLVTHEDRAILGEGVH